MAKTESQHDDSSAYGKQIEKLNWCSACKQGFSETDYPDFDFTRCPVCGQIPPEGFLPWSWVRAHWSNQLPLKPEPGVTYEDYPPRE